MCVLVARFSFSLGRYLIGAGVWSSARLVFRNPNVLGCLFKNKSQTPVRVARAMCAPLVLFDASAGRVVREFLRWWLRVCSWFDDCRRRNLTLIISSTHKRRRMLLLLGCRRECVCELVWRDSTIYIGVLIAQIKLSPVWVRCDFACPRSNQHRLHPFELICCPSLG